MFPLSQFAVSYDLLMVAACFAGELDGAVMRFGQEQIEVVGTLTLKREGTNASVTTPCRWIIRHPWRILAPIVFCTACWVKPRGADWHVHFGGSLCYVHCLQWAEAAQLAGRNLSPTELAAAMAAFATNNLGWLLARHLEAFRLNLGRWPRQWPGWPHGAHSDAIYYSEGPRHLQSLRVKAAA